MRIKRLDDSELTETLRVIERAFAPSGQERALVEALARKRCPLLLFGACDVEEWIGVVIYSRAFRGAEPIGWHLAPVAVLPECQGRGAGSALIEESLADEALAQDPVFVLGDPAYYTRFGLTRERTVRCPFDPSGEHFLSLRWREDEPFTVGYESPFAELE